MSAIRQVLSTLVSAATVLTFCGHSFAGTPSASPDWNSCGETLEKLRLAVQAANEKEIDLRTKGEEYEVCMKFADGPEEQKECGSKRQEYETAARELQKELETASKHIRESQPFCGLAKSAAK